MLARLRVDLLHAWRGLSARRGSAAAIVAILALGVGLTTAVFALTDPYLWRPLPYPNPDRLVVIHVRSDRPRTDQTGSDRVPTVDDWRARTDLFDAIAAYGELEQVRLITADGALLLTVRPVSSNFLSVLGAEEPVLAETASGGPRVLVVDPSTSSQSPARLQSITGQTLDSLDGRQFQVARSLNDSFLFPHPRLRFRPAAVTFTTFDSVTWRGTGSTGSLTGIGRLQPGIAPGDVETALNVGSAETGIRVELQFLATYLTASERPLALGALAAGLMIAVVCAANVLNLLMTRSVYRSKEFATRQALGATRLSLLRLLAIELAMLAVAAVAIGHVVAKLVLAACQRVIPAEYAALGTPALTFRTTVFALGLGAAIAAASAIPGSLGAWRTLASSSGPRIAAAAKTRRFRSIMLAGQSAIAMTLLVGAIFLSRSYLNLRWQDTGYSGSAATVSVSHPVSSSALPLLDEVAAALEALRRVPGVSDAAAGVGVGFLLDEYSAIGGASVRIGDKTMRLVPAQVTPGYFHVAGTRIVAGRSLMAGDAGWDAVVVNQAFATHVWPGASAADAIGQVVVAGDVAGRIVGVAENTHDRGLDIPSTPRIYRPLDLSSPVPRGRVSYLLRPTVTDLPDVAIRRAIASANPAAVVEDVSPLEQRLADTVRDQTFATLVLALFAAATLCITGTGVFGLVAFVVARRTREIAIRRAIGASAGHVRRLVMGEAVLAVLTGSVAGLIAGIVLLGTIEAFLFGVAPGDAVMPALAALGMAIVTGAAAWWPARRALRLEPTTALRDE